MWCGRGGQIVIEYERPGEKSGYDSQDINLRVQALELKVQTAETAGPEGGNTAEACHDNGVSDEKLIKFVVQEELQKKTVVEKDLESRKKNIIIYRVPEKKTEVVAERRQNDLSLWQICLMGSLIWS